MISGKADPTQRREGGREKQYLGTVLKTSTALYIHEQVCMTNLRFILQLVLIVTNLKCIKEYKIKILSQTHPTLGSPEV